MGGNKMKLGLAAAFLSATLLAGTASAADKRWDGADDLPVNPLACSAGEANATPAAKPYDGGRPTNAAESRSSSSTITSPAASTAFSSPPTIRWRSRRS
jgi:rhamnose transport system substrate-binding protein